MNPQYTDYGLLVPRDPVKFKIVPGWFESLNTTGNRVTPLVRTTDENFNFEGIESGTRSGLLLMDGLILKIKGCNIGAAFKDGCEIYRTTRDELFKPGKETYGGQVLADAEKELRWLAIYNQIISQEGFLNCQEPIGNIYYDKKFKRDRRQNWTYSVFLLEMLRKLSNPELTWEQVDDYSDKKFNAGLTEQDLAASAMKVKGDTRLPELYRQRVSDTYAEAELAYKFGLMAGAQKRITENTFLWGVGNAHDGNYVIFSEGDNVYLAMADFDGAHSAKKAFIKLSSGGIQAWEGELLKRRFYRNPSSNFVANFRRGFSEGHKNPDKRGTITLEMLCEAYDLESAHPVHV